MNFTEEHKKLGALFIAVAFSFTVFYGFHNSFTQSYLPADEISFQKESYKPIVLRNGENSTLSFNPAIKDAFTDYTYDCFIEWLPAIELTSAKALFINNYQRNTFYVFTSIHAP